VELDFVIQFRLTADSELSWKRRIPHSSERYGKWGKWHKMSAFSVYCAQWLDKYPLFGPGKSHPKWWETAATKCVS
jgi:hypothetical protein